MLPTPIDRAARLPLGSASVREFAAREFPREDPLWVASVTRESRIQRVRFAVVIRGLVGRFVGSRELEPEPERASEPSPA